MTNKNLKTPRTFDELHRLAAAGNRAQRVRLAVVCGRDRATLDAVAEAVRCGWITPTFVGAVEEVKEGLPSDVLPLARFFSTADGAADDAADGAANDAANDAAAATPSKPLLIA